MHGASARGAVCVCVCVCYAPCTALWRMPRRNKTAARHPVRCTLQPVCQCTSAPSPAAAAPSPGPVHAAPIPWGRRPIPWPSGGRRPLAQGMGPIPSAGDGRRPLTQGMGPIPSAGDGAHPLGQGTPRGWGSPGPGDGSPESGPLPQGMARGCPSAAQGMARGCRRYGRTASFAVRVEAQLRAAGVPVDA